MMTTWPDALAKPADLAAWTKTAASSNADILLRSATSVVLNAVTALYDTDSGGVATDAGVKQAMRDATCAQAAAWAKIGFDPLTGGIPTSGGRAFKAIGGAQISYAASGQAAQQQWESYTSLTPEAARILAQQNLLDPHLWGY